jgi:hypothetical protein
MTEVRLDHIVSHLDLNISYHIGTKKVGQSTQNIFFAHSSWQVLPELVIYLLSLHLNSDRPFSTKP